MQAVTPLSPKEIAYESLKSLNAENLPAQGRIKEYYIRLSGIVRRYIEDQFNVRAPEMTTAEFLLSLKMVRWLSAGSRDALEEFLKCCDMVKFAKHASTHQEMEQSFVLVKRLIDETSVTPYDF